MNVWAVFEFSNCQECRSRYLVGLFCSKVLALKYIQKAYKYKWQYELEEWDISGYNFQ